MLKIKKGKSNFYLLIKLIPIFSFNIRCSTFICSFALCVFAVILKFVFHKVNDTIFPRHRQALIVLFVAP